MQQSHLEKAVVISHQLGCSIGAANSLAKAPLAEAAAMLYFFVGI